MCQKAHLGSFLFVFKYKSPDSNPNLLKWNLYVWDPGGSLFLSVFPSVSHATSLASGHKIVFVETNVIDIYYATLIRNEKHESMSFIVFIIEYPIKIIVTDLS